MLNRLVDGLRKAQSKALEMIKSPFNEQPTIFTEFINGLKIAAGSAHQMAHTQVDHAPGWLNLRDRLEKIIEIGQTLPTLSQKNNGAWFGISKSLGMLVEVGQKLATSKALSRAEVLFEMDVREKNAPGLVTTSDTN